MSKEKIHFYNKYLERVTNAFNYSHRDCMKNIEILVNAGKEVPRSVTVTFTINLEDVIDVEAKEIKDEDKK